jgi:hypothetical protein
MIEPRLRRLQWMLWLKIAWETLLWAAVVGVLVACR